MNKKVKILVALMISILVLTSLGFFTYFKYFQLRKYEYNTRKGQQYALKYFPDASIVDSKVVADKLANTDLASGTPMLVAYLKQDLGVALYITETLGNPLTKTCTGNDQFAFAVDNFEVCKLTYKNKTSSLLAKVGNDGKYFMVVASAVYDGRRILEDKDKGYAQELLDFDLLQYKNQLRAIFKSVRPIN